MSMQDPIADMLTRIRNAQAAKEIRVKIPSSKMKIAMIDVLKEEGYVGDYTIENDGGTKKNILLVLKYYQGNPVIEKIQRISKPSLRIYRSSKDLPVVRAGMGIAIISTPQGIMSGKAAKAQGLGGEVLCIVE